MSELPGKPHSVTGLQPPKHISFSAREQLERCAKSFFLSRMAYAPRQPALWLAGGSAVHEVTEAYDQDQVNMPLGGIEWTDKTVEREWNIHFAGQLDKLRKADPNEWNWRRSQSEPIERWNAIGPEFVRSYIDWRKRSPYEIWTTPDGVPAIELDISGYLPGCPVEIKAYLDRVFHDPVFDQLIIVDLKTSKRPPKNSDQFATYAALLAAKYDGVVPALGAPFMNRRATLGTPYPLLAFTPEAVGEIYGTAWEQIQSGEFPATPGEACFLCDVSASCYAKRGPLSHLYDPDHPDREVVPF